MARIFEFIFSLTQVHLDDLSRVHLSFDFKDLRWLGILVFIILGLIALWAAWKRPPGRRSAMGITFVLALAALATVCIWPSLVEDEANPERSVIYALLVVVLIWSFGFWSYKRQSAAPGKRIAMGVIRGLMLAVLLALCLRPQLVLEETKPERGVIAVWIDDSQAMDTRDPYTDPLMRAQAQKLFASLSAATTQPAKAKWPTRWQMAIDTLLHDDGLHQLAGKPSAVKTPVAAAPKPELKPASMDLTPVIVGGSICGIVAIGLALFLFSTPGRKFSGGQRLAMGGGSLAVLAIVMGLVVLSATPPKPVDVSPEDKYQEVAIFIGHDDANLVGRATKWEQIDEIVNRIKNHVPDGPHTDIPRAVKHIFNELQGQPIASVILLTDGTSSPEHVPVSEATQIARNSNTPIFPIEIGSLTPLRNSSIEALDVASDVFLKDPVLVTAHVRVISDQPGTTHVTLYRRPTDATDDKKDEVMKTPDGKDVSVPMDFVKGDTRKDVELIFKPMKIEGDKEDYRLVAKLDLQEDELSEDDNVKENKTTIMDTKLNVLYVEGYPRWEYRYLKNELLREGTINVSVLLLSADDSFAQEGTIRKNPNGGPDDVWTIQRFPETEEEMLKYDVILLGDVEPEFFSPAQMQLVLNFVKKNGGGIGWIAGDQFNPDSYKNTPMLPLLPIDPDDPAHHTLPQPQNTEFKVKATADGFASPLFRFFDDPEKNKTQMADNASLYWYKPVLGPHQGTQVLAVHPTEQVGGQPMPLIVYGQYGDGRVLFSGIADTWRWRRYKGEPLFQSYWLQVCRMLYAGKIMGQNHKVQLQADAANATVGKPLGLTLTIHDPTLLPTAPEQITLQVTDKNGKPGEPVILTRVEEGNTYTGEVKSDILGNLKLEVAPGALGIQQTSLDVEVKVPANEEMDLTVDETALADFAKDTKGKVLKTTGMEGTDQLVKLVSNRSKTNLSTVPEELWTKPFALVIILLLVVAEWLLRKQSGLI